MRLGDTVEESRFREEARDWLSANVPRERRPENDGDAQRAYDISWRRRQAEAGWGHIAWPKQYGGRELSVAHQLIWYEETVRSGGPSYLDMFFVALQHAGPTLIAKGSEAQKAFYLGKILNGETIWCQGFSEPGAGSDLAAIKTRGVVEGDSLVVTGQKLWTSFGKYARFQELLIRTEPGSSRHKGLTWLICPMDSKGVEIRPIRNIAGGDDFCEVFYDQVRVPLANVVGELGDGWNVAMSTLGFERGAASVPQVIELERKVENLIELAKIRGRRAASADSEDFSGPLAAARADVAALRSTIYFIISRRSASPSAAPEGSIIRVCLSELAQRISSLAIDILGASCLERSAADAWPRQYLIDLKHTIAGGTSEIQRNIIGERVLGLPRARS